MSEDVKFRATPDFDGEDPRKWDEEYTTVIWRDTYGVAKVDDKDARFQLFARFYGHRDANELGLRNANRYARLFDMPELRVHNLHGYSQGDWWEVLSDAPDGFIEAFGQWLRGDVWLVESYVTFTCSLGYDHDETVEYVGGVYADSEEEAIEQVRGDMLAQEGVSP